MPGNPKDDVIVCRLCGTRSSWWNSNGYRQTCCSRCGGELIAIEGVPQSITQSEILDILGLTKIKGNHGSTHQTDKSIT